MEWTGDLPMDEELPPWSEVVRDAIELESARVRELELACRANIPLPEGWSWEGQLLLTVLDHVWVIRATLIPQRSDMEPIGG